MVGRRELCWLVFVAALLLLAGGPGEAKADNWAALSWDACGGGVPNKQFACNSNTGGARVVVSALRTELERVVTVGFDCHLEVVAASAYLPTWWQMGPGQCRAGSLSASALAFPEDAACFDAWAGVMSTVTDVSNVPGEPRILLWIGGTDHTMTSSMGPSLETFVVAVNVSYERSIGAGSCEGCLTTSCIVLRSFTVHDLDVPPEKHIPLLDGRDMLAWQTTREDCIATSVRQKTWGAIKSLYR